MITYNDDELSCGAQYIVHSVLERRTLGLFEYDGHDLLNDSETIIVSETYDGAFWIMAFDWPTPPRSLSEKSKAF